MHLGTIASKYELQRNPACQTDRSSCCPTLHNLPPPGSGDANRPAAKSACPRQPPRLCNDGRHRGAGVVVDQPGIKVMCSVPNYLTQPPSVQILRVQHFGNGIEAWTERQLQPLLPSKMCWLHRSDSDRQTWPRGCARPTPEVAVAIKRTTMMSQNGSGRPNGTYLTTMSPEIRAS